MADVEVTYRGQIIRSMSASGTEVLHTEGKLCDDDITIDYTSPGGGGANLQTKSVSYTPDETGISDTILPDPGYDGMDEVDVTVAAIPDTYVGSAIPQRDSSDLLVTGRLVRVPAGYYASMAGAQVAMGTEGTPTASKGAVSNHSVDVTPSVTNVAGYINGGTQTGTPVKVSASELVSGSQTVTVNDTYDVTNLAEMVVNVSGGTEIDVYPGPANINVNFTLDPITKINIKPSGTAANNYCHRFVPYNQVNDHLMEYYYDSGLNSNFSNAASAGTLFYNCQNISKMIFPEDTMMPASVTGFLAGYKIGTIPHVLQIKGLNFSNCTNITGFATNNTSAQFDAAGISIDLEWRGTINVTTLSIRTSASACYRFTHDSLLSLLNALSSNGGTLSIGTANLDTLSAAEIAIATAKGWTVSA